MSRATFVRLAAHPIDVVLMERSQIVAALEWNDPNGSYRDEFPDTTDDQLRVMLLAQVINSIERS